VFVLFHRTLSMRDTHIFILRLRAVVWCIMSCVLRTILNSIIRHARPLGIGVLRGRKDRGRGYGPIRHGALSAMNTASVQAISLRVGVVHGAHASWNARDAGCRVSVAVCLARAEAQQQVWRKDPSVDIHASTAIRKRPSSSFHHALNSALQNAQNRHRRDTVWSKLPY
jgi:hypothetical protein